MVFYTKKGCPLCDEARELLHCVQRETPFTMREVDIMTDSAIYEHYKTIIPVVVIDGKVTLGARIEEDELHSCLKEASASHRE
ncbi:MAG: glutaredoxin family protein [Dehalococcoidia bacterium]|nr:glutaredoxin family protein [Dehalococcoidia bacterium]